MFNDVWYSEVPQILPPRDNADVRPSDILEPREVDSFLKAFLDTCVNPMTIVYNGDPLLLDTYLYADSVDIRLERRVVNLVDVATVALIR